MMHRFDFLGILVLALSALGIFLAYEPVRDDHKPEMLFFAFIIIALAWLVWMRLYRLYKNNGER